MGPIISSNQRHKSHHPLHETTRQGAAAFDSSAIIVLNRCNLRPNAECGAEASIEPRGTTVWRIHPSDLGPFILFII